MSLVILSDSSLTRLGLPWMVVILEKSGPENKPRKKKPTKHLTIKHKAQVNLSVDEMFAVEDPTLNEMRLFHRGDSASTFRAAAEKKIESHLMA